MLETSEFADKPHERGALSNHYPTTQFFTNGSIAFLKP